MKISHKLLATTVAAILTITLAYQLHNRAQSSKVVPASTEAAGVFHATEKLPETALAPHVCGDQCDHGKPAPILAEAAEEAARQLELASLALQEALAANDGEAAKEAAQLRRDSMIQLIRSNPAVALDKAVKLRDYVALPAELLPFFEKPVSTLGNIDLRWSTRISPQGGLQCNSSNHLSTSNGSFTAYGPGFRKGQTPAFGTSINGYTLAGDALLHTSPVMRLSAEDLPAAISLYPQGSTGTSDPLTGEDAAHGQYAVIGGHLYAFTHEATLEEVERHLAEAEHLAARNNGYQVEHGYSWLEADSGGSFSISGNVRPLSFFADDNIDVLFIRADFSDHVGEPVSKAALESDLSAVSNHLNTFSYGTASINASVTTTLYRASNTGASYEVSGDDDALHADIVAQYDASPDYNASNTYDVIAVIFPELDGQIDYGGLANVGGPQHWINGDLFNSSNRINTITHEFGHNYGLYHSNYYDPGQLIGGSYRDTGGVSLEYGDIFDTMGNGDLPESHFSMFNKNKIDWLPDSKIAEPGADGTYRIYRFDHIDALDNPLLALRVPMEEDVYYWIGYRKLYSSNTSLSNGAYVIAEAFFEDKSQDSASLIDMTDGSASPESSDRLDAGLTAADGAYVYPGGGVTITTIGTGTDGAGDEWIDVNIDFDSRIGFASTTLEVDEQAGVAYLTLQREFSAVGAVSVDYSTSAGTASSDVDFYAASGTVTWADGDSADKVISVNIIPDSVDENSEDFTVTLSNVNGDAVLDGGATTITVTLLDPGIRFSSFTPAFFNSVINSIVIQDDDKAIIAGLVSHSSGDFLNAGNITRLNLDGSRDHSFNSGGSGFNGEVEAVVPDSNGNLYVIGNPFGPFSSYNGTPVPNVAKLSSNGVLDTTFNTNIGTANDNGSIYGIAVDANDRLLLCGTFTSFNGSSTDCIIRIASDGTVERTFSELSTSAPGFSLGSLVVYCLHAQDDGKFLAGGFFYVDNADHTAGIARFNSDGTLDATFDAGFGSRTFANSFPQSIYAITRLQDGKYLIGGDLERYDNNVTSTPLARINSDGSYEGTYTAPAFNSDFFLEPFFVQPSGQALIGGSFTTPDEYLVRLDSALALDAEFTEDGASSFSAFGNRHINAIAQDSQGGVWLGGNFFDYNNASSRPVVRVAAGTPPYGYYKLANFTQAQIASGDADEDADPDGDGLNNLAEMALGTNPNLADAQSIFASGGSGSFSFYEDGASKYLQITLDKRALSGGAWYCVQVSSDLINWTPDPVVPNDTTTYDIIEDTQTTLTVRDKTAISPSSPRFMRIIIKTPQP